MNCEKIQQRFLEMDNRSIIPVSVQFHMLFCPKCRRDIAFLNDTFRSLKNESQYDMDRDRVEEIMLSVFHSTVRHDQHVSGFQWSAVGLIILVSLFAIPFSTSFDWLRHFFGPGLEIPVSIVLGLVFSAYALAGIFSNLEELKKFVEKLPKKLH